MIGPTTGRTAPDSIRNARGYATCLLALSLIAFLLLVLVRFSPAYQPVPTRDSGVFLYMGRAIRAGAAPYADVWDQKPPLIFYINAFGLALGGGSADGVYWLKAVLLGVTVGLGFASLRRGYGTFPAFFGTLLLAAYRPVLMDDGNVPEEYALPLQVAATYLAVWEARHRDGKTVPFILGLLAGAIFLLKPTLVGVPLAVFFLLASDSARGASRRVPWQRVLLVGMGFVLPIVTSVVVAVFQGSIGDYWSCVVVYGLRYAALKESSFVEVWRRGVSLFHPWVLATVAAGYLASVANAIRMRGRGDPLAQLARLGMLALPIEAIFLGIPHRSYMHYYVAMLPVFSILAGQACAAAQELARWLLGRILLARWAEIAGIAAAAAIGTMGIGRIAYRDLVRATQVLASPRPDDRIPIVEYIRSTTLPSDDVLFWGAEAGLNFLSDRDAPGRFVYQYPLVTPGYTSPELLQEFRLAIEHSSPALIIDASSSSHGGIPSMALLRTGTWAGVMSNGVLGQDVVAEFAIWAEWARNNYREESRIGNWVLYRRLDS